jgi:four helix bundle protein
VPGDDILPPISGAARATPSSRGVHSANIAEGCGKPTDAELARFSEIALGSTTELDNHLLFARDTGAIDPARYMDMAEKVAEVRRMLFSFVRAVRSGTTPQ